MQLRNGKIKPLIAKCYACNKFYGNKKYRYMCSGCYKGLSISLPWHDPEFRTRLKQWAEVQIIESKQSCLHNVLRQMVLMSYSSNCNPNALSSMVQELKTDFNSRGKNLYISAKDGEELLRRTGLYCDRKSHIICPLILDWWNMKHYDFNGTEMCYFGRFGDEMTFAEQITSIPPPPPNRGFC
jgi:hypothetical protein